MKMQPSWKWPFAALAFVLTVPTGELSAFDRTWHGPTGEVISRGDYFGVRNGHVILAEGSNRKFFPLSAFSLDDRDTLIELMKRRKHDVKIAEMMQFENLKGQPRPALGPAGNGENGAAEIGAAEIGIGGEAPVAAGGVDALLSIAEPTTRVYGLPVPFPGLLEEAPSRTWTSLLGQKMPAVFEELVAPAHVKLRAVNGQSNTFALVNFERDDLDWLKETIAADAEKDIFPAADPQPLTPEETEKKYRTWTDRKGRRLNAGFVRADGRQVVLDTAAGPQSFALIGISGDDRNWIQQEMLRRAEEARRQQEEAQRRAEQAAMASNNSGHGGAHGGGGPFGGGPFGGPGRRFSMPEPPSYRTPVLGGSNSRYGGGHGESDSHARNNSYSTGGHGEGDPYSARNSHTSGGYTPPPMPPTPSMPSSRDYTSSHGIDTWQCERCKHIFTHAGEPSSCPKCGNSPNFWPFILLAKVVVGLIVFFIIRAVRS